MVTQLQSSKSLGTIIGEAAGAFGAGVGMGAAEEFDKQMKVDRYSKFVESDDYKKAPLDQKLSLTSMLFGKDVEAATQAAFTIQQNNKRQERAEDLQEQTLELRKKEAELREKADKTNAKAVKQRMIKTIHDYADEVSGDLGVSKENRPLFKDLITEAMDNTEDMSLSGPAEEAARIVNTIANYDPIGYFSGPRTPEERFTNLVEYAVQNKLPMDKRVYDKMAKKVGLTPEQRESYWRQWNGKPPVQEKAQAVEQTVDEKAIAEATQKYPPEEYAGRTGSLPDGRKLISDGKKWQIIE